MIAASHVDLLRVIRAPGQSQFGIESHAVLRFVGSISVPPMPYNSTLSPISTSSCAFFQYVAWPQRPTAAAARTPRGGACRPADSFAEIPGLPGAAESDPNRLSASECEIDLAGGVPATALAALAHPSARHAELGGADADA